MGSQQLKPQYSTWIRSRKVIIFTLLAAVSLVGVFFAPISGFFLLFLVPFVIFGYILVIMLASIYWFSAWGGNYQNKVHDLLLLKVPSVGTILDIGCGSGNLAIACAKGSKQRIVQGLDYWGKNWEYSKMQCEENARLEGVSNQVSFKQGTASHLPYDNKSMDAVASCLTFHEVKDIGDKTVCLTEALRVLKPGGVFVFFDLFNNRAIYPELQMIIDKIEQAGGIIDENYAIGKYLKLPFPLTQKKVLGYGQLIFGWKNKI